MNKKNIVIDLDAQRFHYEDGNESVTGALAIVNENLAHANALIQMSDIGEAANYINKVESWLGWELATITTAAEAYDEIHKIYANIEATNLIKLPAVCPFNV